MTEVVSYVELDVPHCSLTYSVPPCQATLTGSPPTGTIKCFNSLGTCQDRENYTDVPVTLRFSEDTDFLPTDIEAFPFILSIDFTPAIVSLGGDLGQRATLKVVFRDAPHSDAGDRFDKYPESRDYTDPFARGTFWGKFRARNPFLRGVDIRLIRGTADQPLAQMETRHYIVESYDGPTPDGTFAIIAKDVLKLADGDRAQAPTLSTGVLASDITETDVLVDLLPAGIRATEYGNSGHATIGGNEVVLFERGSANTRLLLHMDGADASTTFTDSSVPSHTVTPSGNVQIDTAQSKFGGGSGLWDGTGDFLTLDGSSDFAFGTGPFTVEMWIRNNSLGVTKYLYDSRPNGGTGLYPTIFMHTDNTIRYHVNGLDRINGTTAIGSGGAFRHVAVVRDLSGNTKLYINGTQEGATYADGNNYLNGASRPVLGNNGNAPGNGWNGWMDEVRVSKGIARYTANFTPAASAFDEDFGDTLYVTRAQKNTEPSAHSAGDRVQLGLQYTAQDGADIISDLLQTYAGVPSAHVPLSTWQTETTTFLGTVYTLFIAEPTAVKDLISEMIIQMGAAVWQDDKSQLVKLQILRAISTIADRYNEDNVLAGTLDVREQPEKRVTQVWVYFAPINPLKKLDDTENYSSIEIVTDAQAELDEGVVIKKIFARGVPAGGRSVATRIGELHLSRYVRPPRRFNFDLLKYAGSDPTLGGGYRLGGGDPSVPSWPFQDETGARVDIPIQITRLNSEADRYEVEVEEMLSSGDAGDLSPGDRTIIIDIDEDDVNLRTRHDALFTEAESGDTVTCIIAAGTIVGASSSAIPAFDVGSWPAGVAVSLIVNGRIQGRGGNGGAGGASGGGPGGDGLPGGTALYTRYAVSVTHTDGEIWGGAGGGGGGTSTIVGGGGGGGGAGQQPGLGGSAALADLRGDDGTTEAGGDGGGTGAGAGGDGGGPALAGSPGTGTGFGDGGAAGVAIDGASFVTVVGAAGDIRGGEVN